HVHAAVFVDAAFVDEGVSFGGGSVYVPWAETGAGICATFLGQAEATSAASPGTCIAPLGADDARPQCRSAAEVIGGQLFWRREGERYCLVRGIVERRRAAGELRARRIGAHERSVPARWNETLEGSQTVPHEDLGH